MILSQLRPPLGSKKRRKIVGRGPGSGHGKTSCRGQKGQMSRSSRWTVKGSEGGQMPLIKRLPKVGFRSKNPTLYQVVNVESLNKFANGAVITAQSLKEQGLIESLLRPFKILGDGELKKSVVIQEGAFSKAAEEKIKNAGGKIEIKGAKDVKEVKEIKKEASVKAIDQKVKKGKAK